MARRKHVEKLTGLPANPEPCVVLFGKEMEAWNAFKAASQTLLKVTTALKAASAEREQRSAALLDASHDTIVEMQSNAQKWRDQERHCISEFQAAQAKWRDTLTALAAAVAPG